MHLCPPQQVFIEIRTQLYYNKGEVNKYGKYKKRHDFHPDSGASGIGGIGHRRLATDLIVQIDGNLTHSAPQN